MGKLLLIIPLIIGCDTEAVTDVDALYNAYLCNVGPDAGNPGPQNPENPSRPDSIDVRWENVGYTGDLSYTEDDAVVECEVAYSDSCFGPEITDSDGNCITKLLFCECEKSN